MKLAGRLGFLTRPWIWSYLGALLVWLAAIAFTHGYGAGGMITAALALAVFCVITGVAQMFVITLGPGNVDLSLPANIGLASAVAMKVMHGSDAMIAAGLLAALVSGICIGIANYLLIWLLRIPPIIATLSASFIIQSVGISYGRGLQIKPPPASPTSPPLNSQESPCWRSVRRASRSGPESSCIGRSMAARSLQSGRIPTPLGLLESPWNAPGAQLMF